MSEFAKAFDRFNAEFVDAVTATHILGHALAAAHGIAAYAGPRAFLGWTRRKWARERRRWNAGRRTERARHPRRVVVAAPVVAAPGEDVHEQVLDMLRQLGTEWRAVMHTPLPPPRSFEAYVGRCLAAGRVPMRGGVA